MQLLTALSKLGGLKELGITTNGVLTAPHVAELKKIGVRSVNLSLDTLDANRFFTITRRDEFANVMETMEQLLKHDIEVKINTVVMAGKNTQDIIPLVELTKDLPVSVRFIEEMPFNGDGHSYSGIVWDYVRIFDEIRQRLPEIQKVPDPQYSTSYNYQIPGHKGSIGIIAAYSRTFCGTCNRIRITPQGTLKNCLYDDGVRSGMDNARLEETLRAAFNNRQKDGWQAEQKRMENPNFHESMATIGG
jgi:cyclic pyranopterin phosphate synthase